MKYTLHPGADRDLDEACLHYRRSASGLVVVRFLDEFERVARLLAREPGIGTLREGGRASFPLRGFPFTLIYKRTDAGIRVLVVRHQHRDPEHGEDRR
jgi:plasmid stabilization system protein ParE